MKTMRSAVDSIALHDNYVETMTMQASNQLFLVSTLPKQVQVGLKIDVPL